jgi:hypothetical protein
MKYLHILSFSIDLNVSVMPLSGPRSNYSSVSRRFCSTFVKIIYHMYKILSFYGRRVHKFSP